MDRVRREIRLRHYSIRTESAYVEWIKRFIVFNDKRHPKDLGPADVAAFLTHLAVDRHVAPSTQGQAKSAILFLYRVVLNAELPWLDEIVAAKNPRRLPVVLTPSEVRLQLEQMHGTVGLGASLLYGTGTGCSKAFACGSKTLRSSVARSPCGTAREARIGSPCCRRT